MVPLPDANPRTLDRAIAQEKDAPGPRPLLVAPYYDQEKLNRLMQDRVSGIDLCGNGVVFLGLSFYKQFDTFDSSFSEAISLWIIR